MDNTTLRTESLGSFDSTDSPRHLEGGREGSWREEGKIRRVLIVDDDAAIRMVCAISLQPSGWMCSKPPTDSAGSSRRAPAARSRPHRRAHARSRRLSAC
jgi:hypothetical protein